MKESEPVLEKILGGKTEEKMFFVLARGMKSLVLQNKFYVLSARKLKYCFWRELDLVLAEFGKDYYLWL